MEDELEVIRNARAEGVHYRLRGGSWWEVLVRLIIAGIAYTIRKDGGRGGGQ